MQIPIRARYRRPKVIAVLGVYQLRRHADAIPRLANAAFEDRPHPQRRSDRHDVLLLAAKREGRCARSHLPSGELRQHVDDLFSEAVAEVILFLSPLMLANGSTAIEGWSSSGPVFAAAFDLVAASVAPTIFSSAARTSAIF
jgi:hypothetical protein